MRHPLKKMIVKITVCFVSKVTTLKKKNPTGKRNMLKQNWVNVKVNISFDMFCPFIIRHTDVVV